MGRTATACIAILFGLFQIGACIKCYQCNTEQDRTCGDPFSSTKNLVDCTMQDSVTYNQRFLYAVLPAEVFGSVVGAPRYCHKIIMESGTVIRTCLDANPTNMNHSCRVMEDVSKLASPDKKIKYCSVCDKDSCNSATSFFVSLPLAALTVILPIMFSKQ